MGNLSTLSNLGWQIFKARVTKKRQPIFLSLFITNRCNLRCKYCFVVDDSVPKEILRADYSKEEAFKVIDEFYAMGTRMIYLLGGEPLVHKDIGAIIDYIVKKGIYLHTITNGTLIRKRLDEIKNTHALCVSLDGIGNKNDALRGDRVFEKAVDGIQAAVEACIPTRIHAVLTRHNLHDIRELAQLAKDLKVELTISPPNYLGTTDLEYMRISKEEYKVFWKEYYQLYKDGYPIANAPEAIRKCIDWPVDYHEFIKVGQKHPGYSPTFCLNGHTYVALGAEGTMYNCINLGCLNGPDTKDLGIKGAWEKLLNWRPNCTSCSSINCIETAMMLNMSWESLSSAAKFHFFRKK